MAGLGGDNYPHESSDESSEEEVAELRRRNVTSDSDTTSHHSYHSAGADTCVAGRTVSHVSQHEVLPAARTLSAHLPSLHLGHVSHVSGMVRNSTEPQQRLSEMTLSQSTWI